MVRFGVHAGLQNTTVDELASLWVRVEELGFDWISVWDHFYAADLSGNPRCLEAVSMHAALALSTERVRCGCLVYSVGYRHPAVLANAVATIDHLSGGRATLGMGAGWCQPEYEAYGIEFPSPRVRLRQLEEGVQCARSLLNREVTTFEGDFFTLHEARCEPPPLQQPFPVWIGGGGEQVTLRVAARHADGWNVPFVSPGDFRHKVEVLEHHCSEAGRDPAGIEKSVNVGLAQDEAAVEAQFGPITPVVRPGVLTGSVAEVVDRVGAYRDAGADWVILAVRPPFDVAGLEQFAADVVPHLA